MPTLRVMRGLPASGKSTLARAWVLEAPEQRSRVCRDDLRAMSAQPFSEQNEARIRRQRDFLINEELARGNDVVNDDTNLPSGTVRDLIRVAVAVGADYEIVDLTDVPPDICEERNRERGCTVPNEVIWHMYMKYLSGKAFPLPVPEVKEAKAAVRYYVPDRSLPSAYIFDIDGTVAHTNGRSPYDYSRVDTDLPDEETLRTAQILRQAGHHVIFMSGRKDICLEATRKWLETHFGSGDFTLLMRRNDDNRRDATVKYELFDKNVRDNYWVLAVYDDRDQVVSMWRYLNLKCFQAAPGAF